MCNTVRSQITINVHITLQERLAQRIITTKQGLRRAITEEWRNITPEMCQEIIGKFLDRLKAVIKKKGNRLTGRRTQAF